MPCSAPYKETTIAATLSNTRPYWFLFHCSILVAIVPSSPVLFISKSRELMGRNMTDVYGRIEAMMRDPYKKKRFLVL